MTEIHDNCVDQRYLRNAVLRREARDDYRRISHGRLENQLFSVRTPQPPSVLHFHPYDPHLAVAGKDCFRYEILDLFYFFKIFWKISCLCYNSSVHKIYSLF